jgi:predicted nucleic acid-binding Zn ribbon protein
MTPPAGVAAFLPSSVRIMDAAGRVVDEVPVRDVRTKRAAEYRQRRRDTVGLGGRRPRVIRSGVDPIGQAFGRAGGYFVEQSPRRDHRRREDEELRRLAGLPIAVRPRPVRVAITARPDPRRLCVRCGTAFALTGSRFRLYCSKRCKARTLMARWRARHPRVRPTYERVGPYPVRLCEGCRESFTPRRTDQQWCSRRCGDTNRARARRRARRCGIRLPTAIGGRRSCRTCGAPFTARVGNARYCSPRCGEAWWNARRRSLRADHHARDQRTLRAPMKCPECGETFRPAATANPRKRFCQAYCQKINESRRRKNARAEATAPRRRPLKEQIAALLTDYFADGDADQANQLADTVIDALHYGLRERHQREGSLDSCDRSTPSPRSLKGSTLTPGLVVAQ